MSFMCILHKPTECSFEELHKFEALVKLGNEVDPNGLDERIRSAKILAWALDQTGDMVGVGAIKHPGFGYRQSVFSRAKSQEHYPIFRYEIGWIYVDEPFWGNKIGPNITEKLLSTISGKNIFSTTNESNDRMIKILTDFEFKQSGEVFESTRDDYRLVLYIKKSG